LASFCSSPMYVLWPSIRHFNISTTF
jgi:hypothetical protein